METGTYTFVGQTLCDPYTENTMNFSPWRMKKKNSVNLFSENKVLLPCLKLHNMITNQHTEKAYWMFLKFGE